MIQPGLFAEPQEPADFIRSLAKDDPVTVRGLPYRFHRDCGEHVWLATVDAGISGPFYWERRKEVRRG